MKFTMSNQLAKRISEKRARRMLEEWAGGRKLTEVEWQKILNIIYK